MKVLAFPAFKNKLHNPYNYRLYKEIERRGSEVDEFDWVKVFKKRYNIFHIHWPESMMMQRNLFIGWTRIILFYVELIIFKILGTKIVWTAHNLRSHEFPYSSWLRRRIEILHMFIFTTFLVDGIIILNSRSKDLLIKTFPVWKSRSDRIRLIYHSNYRDLFKKRDRKQARNDLKLNQNSTVIGFFGKIKQYKNVTGLLKTFRKVENQNLELLIAGDPELPELEKKLSILSDQDKRVKTIFKLLTDKEVEMVFSAIDILVLPYKKIHNSGTAILALSFGVPTIVPSKDIFFELRELVGDQWILLYENLTTEFLEQSIHFLKESSFSMGQCKGIEKFDNEIIAQKTLNFFQYLNTKY